jgi:5-methylcytosine-specific restriction endonuclease McrA
MPPPIRAPWPITVDPSDHAKLRDAQALLRHQIPSGDLTKVLSRLIDLGLVQLQKQRHGTGVRTRAPRRPSANPRHIPTAVKQAVLERDGGQCTFTSESGHRCPSRDFLAYDHVVPVARGGTSTVDNLRVRCRAHNQYAAEQTFGREFMKGKREAAASRACRTNEPLPSDPPHVADVIPWLRGLGFRIDEARRAAGACRDMPDAPLEQRMRVALRSFHQKPVACGGMVAG